MAGKGVGVLDNTVGLWQMNKIICPQICPVDKSPLCASIEVTYILTLISLHLQTGTSKMSQETIHGSI